MSLQSRHAGVHRFTALRRIEKTWGGVVTATRVATTGVRAEHALRKLRRTALLSSGNRWSPSPWPHSSSYPVAGGWILEVQGVCSWAEEESDAVRWSTVTRGFGVTSGILLTRLESGTRSSLLRRFAPHSLVSSSSAISWRWKTATWAERRLTLPLGVLSKSSSKFGSSSCSCSPCVSPVSPVACSSCFTSRASFPRTPGFRVTGGTSVFSCTRRKAQQQSPSLRKPKRLAKLANEGNRYSRFSQWGWLLLLS